MRILCLLALGIVAVVGCDTPVSVRGNADTTNAIGCALLGPTVHPSTATIHPGDTLRATVTEGLCGGGQYAPAVRWSSSNPAVADADSLAGLIHARTNGVVTITATEIEDTNVRGAMLLNVVP